MSNIVVNKNLQFLVVVMVFLWLDKYSSRFKFNSLVGYKKIVMLYSNLNFALFTIIHRDQKSVETRVGGVFSIK